MEVTRSFDPFTPLGGGGPVLLQRAAKRCLAADPCYPGQLSDRHQSDLLSRNPGTGRMGSPHHDLLQPARCAMVHRPFQQVLDRKRLVIGQICNDRCDPRSARPRVRSLSEQHQHSVAVCVVPTLHLPRAVEYLARPLAGCLFTRGLLSAHSAASLHRSWHPCSWSGASSDHPSISAWDSYLRPAPRSRRSSSFCTRTRTDRFLRPCC